MHTLRRLIVSPALVLTFVFGPRLAAAGVADGELPSALASALVRVELLVQADDGDEPSAAGWNKRCPKCGHYHDNSSGEALAEERPVSAFGFLVAKDRVLTSDPMIQSRFVRSWQVRVGDETVPARPVAWAADRAAMLLALERVPVAAEPLAFPVDARTAKEPLHTIHHGDEGNGWSVWVQPYRASGWLLQDGKRHLTVAAGSLFVDAAGAPVAISMSERLPEGEAWRDHYTKWPWLEQAAYDAALGKIRDRSRDVFLRAQLELRPLPVRPGEDRHGRGDDDETNLESAQTAVVLSPRRVLVLTALTPSQTARLETVRLKLADGSTINASFVGSSEEYGVLVVDPGRDLPATVTAGDTSWESLRDQMLLTARIENEGDEQVVHCGHLRIASVKTGYKNRTKPVFAGNVENTFFFDVEGRLVGLPLTRRVKAKGNRWDRPESIIVAGGEITRFDQDTAQWADARNRPMSEAESRQLAWLGVDLQPLDRDLALTHGVSSQTEQGQHGALVTQVYPDSPAARAGLKAGDVLLRIQPDGAAKPSPLHVERHAFSDQPFPWERYEEVNEAYYDRIPHPWVPAENALHLQLKDLGVGARYRLDYARAGRVASLDLTVEAGPTHYATAPEVVRDELGFRLRELTFETRRYYQLAEGVEALVLSKVEAGGVAAVAGLKPYELITTVNDQPVGTAEAFARATAAGGVLRLGVRRMNQSRVVVLDSSATKTDPSP